MNRVFSDATTATIARGRDIPCFVDMYAVVSYYYYYKILQ